MKKYSKFNRKSFYKQLEKELRKLDTRELNNRYYGVYYLYKTFKKLTDDKICCVLYDELIEEITLIHANVLAEKKGDLK